MYFYKIGISHGPNNVFCMYISTNLHTHIHTHYFIEKCNVVDYENLIFSFVVGFAY